MNLAHQMSFAALALAFGWSTQVMAVEKPAECSESLLNKLSELSEDRVGFRSLASSHKSLLSSLSKAEKTSDQKTRAVDRSKVTTDKFNSKIEQLNGDIAELRLQLKEIEQEVVACALDSKCVKTANKDGTKHKRKISGLEKKIKSEQSKITREQSKLRPRVLAFDKKIISYNKSAETACKGLAAKVAAGGGVRPTATPTPTPTRTPVVGSTPVATPTRTPTSNNTPLPPQPTATPTPVSKENVLASVSLRTLLGQVEDVSYEIKGDLVVAGGSTKLLIRAVGPGLAPFGVAGTQNPSIWEAGDSTGQSGWDAALASVFGEVGAFRLTAGSKDAAELLVVNATSPKSFSVKDDVTGGVVVAEIYHVPGSGSGRIEEGKFSTEASGTFGFALKENAKVAIAFKNGAGSAVSGIQLTSLSAGVQVASSAPLSSTSIAEIQANCNLAMEFLSVHSKVIVKSLTKGSYTTSVAHGGLYAICLLD